MNPIYSSFEIHRNTDPARARWQLFAVALGHRDLNLAEPCIARDHHTNLATSGREGLGQRTVFKGWAVRNASATARPFLAACTARIYVANRLATFAPLADDRGLLDAQFPRHIEIASGVAFSVEVLCERPAVLRTLMDQLDGCVELIQLELKR